MMLHCIYCPIYQPRPAREQQDQPRRGGGRGLGGGGRGGHQTRGLHQQQIIYLPNRFSS